MLPLAIEAVPLPLPSTLRDQMIALLRGSFEEPEAVLDRELSFCSEACVARAEGQLVSFFLFGWGELEGVGSPRPAVYLGLGANAPLAKGHGVMRELLGHMGPRFFERQAEAAAPALMWGTTVSPFGYRLVRTLLPSHQPTADGSYLTQSLLIVAALRRRLGVDTWADGEHPFVLRALEPDLRFSADEVSRLAQAPELAAFRAAGLRPEAGDQLLFFGDLPPHA